MKRAVLLLAAIVFVGSGACSKSSDQGAPVTLPPITGATCTDPRGDISVDPNRPGDLSEPAGLDLLRGEAKLTDTALQVTFTTAGPIGTVPRPLFVLGQGEPGGAASFELRAQVPVRDPGPGLALEMRSWQQVGPDRVEKLSPQLPVKVNVRDNTLTYEVPLKDLPPIRTYVWQFGSALSGTDRPDAPFDVCEDYSGPAGSAPGTFVPPTTASPTTTIPPVPLGQEQTYRTGTKVTVLGVEDPPKQPKPVQTPPDAGLHIAVVDARVCAPDKAVETGSRFFAVRTNDKRVFRIWFSVESGTEGAVMPQSQLLQPGQCLRGYMAFALPDGVTINEVLYSPSEDGGGALSWKVA